MKHGEVWWGNFEPSLGGEIQKTRPAVIISNEAANKYLKRLQVMPLTSQKPDRVYPGEAMVTFEGKPRKALADQIATVSKERFLNQVGKLSASEMQRLERALRIQLGLEA
jgi:mRNA interferase MazF